MKKKCFAKILIISKLNTVQYKSTVFSLLLEEVILKKIIYKKKSLASRVKSETMLFPKYNPPNGRKIKGRLIVEKRRLPIFPDSELYNFGYFWRPYL